MATGALSLAASACGLPATVKEAELKAIELGSGGLAAQIEQVAKMLDRGELNPSHPWPGALLWQRVRDLHGVGLPNDPVLAPLLALPCAAVVLREAASKDSTGTLDRLADALTPDLGNEDESELTATRAAVSAQRDAIVAKYAGVSIEEVDQTRRQRRFERVAGGLAAEPEEPSSTAFERWQVPLLPGKKYSRRDVQALRQQWAERMARLDEVPPPPVGKGRRPGSKGARTLERRRDLAARWAGLSEDQRRPAALVERYGVSLSTAKRDLAAVKAGSI